MVHLTLQKLPYSKSLANKNWDFLAILLVFLLLANPATAAPKILILGDSLSAGYGIDVEKGWVAKLQQRLEDNALPHEVVNASISGETSAGGLSRLPKLLELYRPNLVVLELGGNDGLRGYPLGRLEANLRKMIRFSRDGGAEPVLLGMRIPPNYGPKYSQLFASIYPKLSEEYQIALVPFFLDQVATDADLMQNDGIHPTANAQEKLLNNVWPVLRPTLGANH